MTVSAQARLRTSRDPRSYYELLGIGQDASIEVIRHSYRRMMQQLRMHPDLGGDTSTAALINKAYAVLSNPERRLDYDASLIVPDVEGPDFAGDGQERIVPLRTLDPARQCVFCDTPHDRGASSLPDATCNTCGSPLHPAEQLRTESSDQRAIARIDKELEITFFTHWRQSKGFHGRTEDISLSGLRLATRINICEAQRVRLKSNIFEAIGYTTHCTPRRNGWRTEYVAGISFLTLRLARAVGGFLSQRV